MDIAIVTGASGGVGLAVARKLVELGYRVYGLGGNYQDLSFTHTDFRGIPCDLTNPSDLVEKADQILREEGNISILVNNAKFFTFKPFEETQPSDFDTTLTVNLLCPLILARVALPSLARLGGHIINIAPHSVDQSRGGPSAAAAAGGLDWLGESLFEELRDFGVRVSTLYPQANRTKAEGPPPGGKNPPRAQINVDAIAEAIEAILSAKHGNFFSRVVLRPERSREQPVPAIFRVPMPKAMEDYPRIKEPPSEEELAENANRRHRDREKTREEERKRRRSEEERIYRERLAGNAQLARDERDDPEAAPLPPRDPELDGDEFENDDEGDDRSDGPDRVNLDERPAAEPERRPHRDGRNERREQRQPQPQQQPREPRPPREPRQRNNQPQRPPQAQPPAEGAAGQPAPAEGAGHTEDPSQQTFAPQTDQPVGETGNTAEGQPTAPEEVKPKKPDLQEMIREQIRLRKEREAAEAAETPAPAETTASAEPATETPAPGAESAPASEAPPPAPKKPDLREILREKMRQKRAAEAAEAQATAETEETKAETEEEKKSRSEEATKALAPSLDTSSPAPLIPSSASPVSPFAPQTGAKASFAPGGTGGSFRPAGGLGTAIKSSLGAIQSRLRRGSVRAALAPPAPVPVENTAPSAPVPEAPATPPVEDHIPAPVSPVETAPETPAPETDHAAETPEHGSEHTEDSSAPRKTPRKAAPRKTVKKAARKAADSPETGETASPDEAPEGGA